MSVISDPSFMPADHTSSSWGPKTADGCLTWICGHAPNNAMGSAASPPSADPTWVRVLQAVRGRRTTLIVFYLDITSFGGPDQNPTFDLGQDVDLYVVRKGDDFARLVRTRDAIRIA